MRDRWRLVTVQNGKRHVSSVVLNEDEARDSLWLQVVLHVESGWRVDTDIQRTDSGTVLPRVAALSGDKRVLRTVKAERFDAFNDVPS